MDKNTWIGLLLIAGILVGFSFLNRPSKEELEILIKTKSFSEIGRNYNVSDNSIRKWCKMYNLPFRKKDL